jgi:hypothetical protein
MNVRARKVAASGRSRAIGGRRVDALLERRFRRRFAPASNTVYRVIPLKATKRSTALLGSVRHAISSHPLRSASPRRPM